MRLGTTELILILIVALVVFGPSRLPKLGKMAGEMVGKTKKQIKSFEDEWEDIEDTVKKPLDSKKKPAAKAAKVEDAVPDEAPAEPAAESEEPVEAEAEADAAAVEEEQAEQ